MNMTRDRLQSIGWFTVLAFCAVLTGSLMLRVNAVKSQVELSQRQIVTLERQNQFLETEYETRANQQQLSDINDLDFGYKAPDAGQYLENERQLAMLGKPREVNAPAPIQVAIADTASGGASADGANADGVGVDGASAIRSRLGNTLPQLASRLMSRAMDVPAAGSHGQVDAGNLRDRLARVDLPEHSE